MNAPIIKETEDEDEEEMELPMEYPHNHLRYDGYIFEPTEREVDEETYTLYQARFNNLYELYDYLKSDPPTNRRVFRRLHSETGSEDFAGKPYSEAVEDLMNEYDPGYEEFLTLQRKINTAGLRKVHKYKLVKTVTGGYLDIPAYSAGDPLCYTTEVRVSKPKFVRIHVTLSYYWGTSKKQVLNRAIIITNVIKALEDAGYSVDLNTFELSRNWNELSYIVIQIKKHGQRMDMPGLYKSLCRVEFLRRILFRVLETLDVTNDWEDGYGSTCSEEFTRKVLRLNSNDIFFDQPRSMGIEGEDLAEDFENAIKHLNLEDKIDIEQAKREFTKDVKKLNLK